MILHCPLPLLSGASHDPGKTSFRFPFSCLLSSHSSLNSHPREEGSCAIRDPVQGGRASKKNPTCPTQPWPAGSHVPPVIHFGPRKFPSYFSLKRTRSLPSLKGLSCSSGKKQQVAEPGKWCETGVFSPTISR